MKNKRLWLGLGLLVLTACAPIEPPAAAEPSPSPAAPTATPVFKVTPLVPSQVISVTPVSTPPSGPVPSVPASLREIAAADLSARLAIPADQIEVVGFESVVWPDSSLGCPQPGMQYLQVLTEGYRLQLKAGKQVYSYHGGEGRGPFLCENPSPAVGGTD